LPETNLALGLQWTKSEAPGVEINIISDFAATSPVIILPRDLRFEVIPLRAPAEKQKWGTQSENQRDFDRITSGSVFRKNRHCRGTVNTIK
jgi:hypothetical protein